MEIKKLAYMPEVGAYRLLLSHAELEVIGALLGQVRLGPEDNDDEYVLAAGSLIEALDAEGSVSFTDPNIAVAATLVNPNGDLLAGMVGDGESAILVLELGSKAESAYPDLDSEFGSFDDAVAPDMAFDFGPADEDIWHGVSHDEYDPNIGSFAGFTPQPPASNSDADVDDFIRACEACAAAIEESAPARAAAVEEESALDALLDSLDDVVVIAADTYRERKAAIVARLLEIADALEARANRNKN